MMVLALITRRFSNMLGESGAPIESYVLPEFLNGAQLVVCKTEEDGAPFCAVTYDR